MHLNCYVAGLVHLVMCTPIHVDRLTAMFWSCNIILCTDITSRLCKCYLFKVDCQNLFYQILKQKVNSILSVIIMINKVWLDSLLVFLVVQVNGWS